MLAFDVDATAFVQVQATELIAQASVGQTGQRNTVSKVGKTIWAGQIVEQDGGAFAGDGDYAMGRILVPALTSVEDLTSSGWLKKNGINSSAPKAIATIETAPKHGSIEALPDGEFRYTPNKGFLGKDFVSFIVDIEGKKTRLNYELRIVKEIFDPKGQNSTPSDTRLALRGDLTAWFDQSAISALLASASNVTLHVADLPGSSVGQTTGTGPSAAITLDKDAAGHGWYIDPTPLDNTDDYLPTSNPNIWQAKAGTAAEGKMDMLSVLLHEYGHALGLEHTADSGDFMASTLQPGQRRLPSSQEMALMSQLVAQIKADMQTADAGGTITPASDSAVTLSGALSSIPADPQLPPGTPVPSGVGLAALLAARQRREGLALALQASKQQTTPQAPSPQMQLAANLTLTNPQFSGSQGWEHTGDVSMANGMATLHETASSQTRLNQAFVVGANDRVLSFTIAGMGLDDANNAPDDAFEVALIFDGVGFSTI
jgi:hypothetical protein